MSRLLLLPLLVLAGCPAPALDDATAARVKAAGAQVSEAAVMADVARLSRLHLDDARFDCATLNVREDSVWCQLSHFAARRFVFERLEALGLTVTLQTVATHPPTTNLLAEVRGTERPDDVILVGAHYDAFHGGADDNSTGVAVMLEVARQVARAPLRRTVRFVGFDLEEYGLVGSSRLVNSGQRVTHALVFDCVGYRDTRPGSQAGLPGFPLPPAGDFIAAIANDASREALDQLLLAAQATPDTAKVQAIIAPGTGAGPLSGNLLRSDHGPFWLSGQSALFLTDTANFRNPHYHQATDLPETVDPEFLAQVARLAAATVVVWGSAP